MTINKSHVPIEKIRSEFPALSQIINNHPFVYLDNAATSLKPKCVIDRITQYYSYETANIHRGAHFLADQGTVFYEEARAKIQKFINASSQKEIIFTRGTTEAINLVASSYGAEFLKPGDTILLTIMEHHSNIVPWQILAGQLKLKIEFIDIDNQGNLDWVDFQRKIPQAQLLAVTACSNTLGTMNQLKEICRLAHEKGSVVLVDGAQSIGHTPTDVQSLDCDFFVFSGHKIFGPTGIGVLYGKKEWLEKMPPYQGGGGMINEVSVHGTTFNEVPLKFEAGTPHISGAIGLGAAIDFINGIGMNYIENYENQLLDFAIDQIKKVPGVQIIGHPQRRSGLVSFGIDGFHHSDIGQIIDQQGIAIRAGHHCTQPLMKRLGVAGTLRASFSIYNTELDIQLLCKALIKARELLK